MHYFVRYLVTERILGTGVRFPIGSEVVRNSSYNLISASRESELMSYLSMFGIVFYRLEMM